MTNGTCCVFVFTALSLYVVIVVVVYLIITSENWTCLIFVHTNRNGNMFQLSIHVSLRKSWATKQLTQFGQSVDSIFFTPIRMNVWKWLCGNQRTLIQQIQFNSILLLLFFFVLFLTIAPHIHIHNTKNKSI